MYEPNFREIKDQYFVQGLAADVKDAIKKKDVKRLEMLRRLLKDIDENLNLWELNQLNYEKEKITVCLFQITNS